MNVTRANPYSFEIWAMWSRAVPQFAPTEECSVWTTSDEPLLGVVIMDLTDRDYNFIILARDKRGRFRAVDVGETYFTRRMAEIALTKRMPEVHAEGDAAFEQGDETGKPLDLFTPLLPKDQLHPLFVTLADGPDFSAARDVISEIANVFEDPDGNFVRNFQSKSFNSRLWEALPVCGARRGRIQAGQEPRTAGFHRVDKRTENCNRSDDREPDHWRR